MKRIVGIFISFILFSSLYGNQNSIGKIINVKGKAEMINTSTGKNVNLRKGDLIYPNIVIKTGAESQVLIEFRNGIQRLILSHSNFTITDSPKKIIDEKSFNEIHKMLTVGGIKAAGKDKSLVWKDEDGIDQKKINEEKKLVASIQMKFEKKKYYEIIQETEKNTKIEKNQKLLPLIGFSYLKLGLGEKSKDLFEKVQDQEIALIGIFLSWIEIGNTEEAKKVYLMIKPTADYYKKLGELIETR